MLVSNKDVSVSVTPSTVEISANQAHNLALIINELATNTVKYAWSEQDKGQIEVHISHDDEMILFEFRDDGQGYPEDVLGLTRHNIGFELIQNIIRRGLNGEMTLNNDQGAVATIRFRVNGPG
jgi:two-component sensor histidine kinase